MSCSRYALHDPEIARGGGALGLQDEGYLLGFSYGLDANSSGFPLATDIITQAG